MKEQKKHTDAFSYFFNLTEKGYTLTDAIKVTSKHCNVSKRTIWNWYAEFQWEKKADIKRAKIVEKMEEKENETLAQNRLNYLKILHKLLDNFIQADFPIEIENIRDLETVIKNCLVLQDSPTDYTKTINTNLDFQASQLFDDELMEQIAEEENNKGE